MSREQAVADASALIDSGAFASALERLVAIRSESQTPEGLPHCRTYLESGIRPILDAMGFAIRILENPVQGCGPVMLATRIEDPTAPTILGYGHGDVIRGLEDQWSRGKGPWQLAREGNLLFGRGTADNKGQHLINLLALQVVLGVRGRLGFNLKFLIETGEENGSTGLREIVGAQIDAFRADVMIASDGPRVRAEQPTLSLGSRGGCNFSLVCRLREGGHHSGNWGGALADPAQLLAHALASITSPSGQILVEEWRPPLPPPEIRRLVDGVTPEAGPDGPVPDPDWGEPGFTPAENIYCWNSFAVLAMVSGNPDRPVNAIAPEARALCQLRYVAGTDVDQILPGLQRHLARAGHDRIQVLPPPPANQGGFVASRTEPDDPWVERVRRSLHASCGSAPVMLPQMGGSICNEVFTGLLGIPAIWIPHSFPGCSQHAPDEHVRIDLCRDALQLMAGLYWDLGAGP